MNKQIKDGTSTVHGKTFYRFWSKVYAVLADDTPMISVAITCMVT